MTKIYLAGSCGSEHRTMMQRIVEKIKIEMCGDLQIYCPFELKIPNAWDMSQEEWSRKVFDADLKALDECDIFLMITPGRNSTAGTNWEQGYAYAKGKRIIVLQYTNDNTSIMTFCGSNIFINSDVDSLMDDVMLALSRCTDFNYRCYSILT